MASAGVIPRSAHKTRPQTARMRNAPVIQHPMTRLGVGDVSDLVITGTASPDMRRPHSVASYPVNVANCVSWSESDLVQMSNKKKRYKKKALVTGSRADEEVLELMAERLVDGFRGVRRMFQANDPSGGESVTKEALIQIIYTCIGHISNDTYDRMLLNLGLDKKDKVSFDLFVSRFSDIEDVKKQWETPVKRAAETDRRSKAHPEESLRDCPTLDWAQLKVAPQAVHILTQALKQRKVDVRSLLPGECFGPGGVVTKLQMRHALFDLGSNLTDLEYRKFWERFDKTNAGFIPTKDLLVLLNLTPEGEPKKTRPVSARKPAAKTTRAKQDAKPQAAAKSAREFVLKHQRERRAKCLEDAFRVEAIRPQSSRVADKQGAVTWAETDRGKTDMEAGSKIRAVMHQRRHGKFDSILDSLHHKFEERYTSLNMAFKLFDIHDDGHVMHIDFRRVLTEFGFPVTAIQLNRLLHRLGVIMKQGLIGYTQLLTRLLNRTDSLVSRTIDDHIQAKLEGGLFDGAEGDNEEDAIARRLVEFLHKDYVGLATFLLRADRKNKGTLPPSALRGAVDRCLGYAMSDKQWAELVGKLPNDGDGGVRYLDFLIGFDNSGEPGAWNLQKFGAVSVPRNKVLTKPCSEVMRLERARTMALPTAQPCKEEHRNIHQLRKELEAFLEYHLYEVEQRFQDLDRKSHKGFSQWQFGALLNLCGFPITDHEIASFWASLPLEGDHSTFDDVIGHVLPAYRLSTKLADKEDDSGARSQRGAKSAVPSRTIPRTSKTTKTSPSLKPRAATAHVHTQPPPSLFLSQTMQKAKPAVLRNWEYLRHSFRNLDPNGLGSVTFQQMQRLVDGLRAGLSLEERNELCDQFDFRNNGRCNYLAFMNAFSVNGTTQSATAYSPDGHTLETTPRDATEPLTVKDALIQIRSKLLKQFKTLRRGFTRNDRSKTGYLSLEDFKRVLADCSVPVSQTDLYHLLSEFDSDMDGRVSYPEFLDALLRVG